MFFDPSERTLIDVVGIILSIGACFYILKQFYQDQQDCKRRSVFNEISRKRHIFYYYSAMTLDLFVAMFLLYLILFGTSYYFGRSATVLFGYGLCNWSISIYSKDETEEEEDSWGYMGFLLGFTAMYIAYSSAMSFVDYVGFILELFSAS